MREARYVIFVAVSPVSGTVSSITRHPIIICSIELIFSIGREIGSSDELVTNVSQLYYEGRPA